MREMMSVIRDMKVLSLVLDPGSWFLILGSNQSLFFIILLTLKSKKTEIIESKTTT